MGDIRETVPEKTAYKRSSRMSRQVLARHGGKKASRQEMTTVSGKQRRDSSFLYAVTLNSENVELLKGFKCDPSSRGGQSILLWTLLPTNFAIWKSVASPSSPQFQHQGNQGITQESPRSLSVLKLHQLLLCLLQNAI